VKYNWVRALKKDGAVYEKVRGVNKVRALLVDMGINLLSIKKHALKNELSCYFIRVKASAKND